MKQRIIDLTRVIEPTDASAQRKFVIHKHDALLEVPGTVRPEGEWYIMSDVELMGHIGTHIEVPYHCLKDGADLSQIPVSQLVGDAVLLDLREAESVDGVSRAHVQAAAEVAGGVCAGDIALCLLGPTPYFATEALVWLVDQGIKLMGINTPGLELPHDRANVNHLTLFRAGIPVIENLANLDQLTRSRVTVYALPVPVKGLDAFPLRVIAVES